MTGREEEDEAASDDDGADEEEEEKGWPARLLRTNSVEEGVEEETGETGGVAMIVSVRVRSGEEVEEATDMMVVVDVEVETTVAMLTIELAFPAFCLLPRAISTSVAEATVDRMHDSKKHESKSRLMRNIMNKKKDAAWLESLALVREDKHLEREKNATRNPRSDDGGFRESEMQRETSPSASSPESEDRHKERLDGNLKSEILGATKESRMSYERGQKRTNL